MNQISSAFTLFTSLLVEAMPFLLIGVLLSSSLIFFLDENKLITKLPKNPFLGAIIGSIFGFFFPVCECGNVPVARRFLLKGLPTSVAVSFLFAAPTINPIVLWSTYVAFRGQPEIVWLRVIFSLTIAITIGCIFSLQSDPRPLLKPRLAKRLTALIEGQKEEKNINIKEYSLLQSGSFILGEKGKPIKMTQSLLDDTDNNSLSLWQKWDLFINNVQYELRELGGILILGSAIAASIQVFVPREIILNLGQGTITSIVAMMILAAVVSICSTVDSFFILSFASTFTTASLVAFLVFGPMIDIKSIGLMLSIFKPRMILYLTAIAAQLTFIFTLSYSYFY
ncbi:MAG: permease [Cyanobacteria bacterium]|nr:permease [Cyanobacteria bacterium CG_2015-16_32_12]NCO79463.1 permease [Cyanobacteria bacterium CG_2015-22_32_23]NCQ03635.1 permease [Cyanobacteria bacterium CG_2015-09_32_10]NCQ41134.1 permease [Cyanobacteria bacterium CG_2015-04_32_10]NCS84740.1 permease [Cyanobacteria bacterium CG_2015-02_32_10]